MGSSSALSGVSRFGPSHKRGGWMRFGQSPGPGHLENLLPNPPFDRQAIALLAGYLVWQLARQ